MLRPRILLVLALALGACGSGGGDGLDTLLPTSTTPISPDPGVHDTTSATAAPDTTVAAPTRSAVGDPSAPATTVAGTLGLSPGGPWTMVDSAPGISTPGLVYELMPKLWVYLPVQEDIANGITWTFTEQDRPIIEAYLQARLVFFRVTATNPFDLNDPGWAEWYTDGGASYESILSERSARGEVFDRDVGVVLRPTVLGEGRTESRAIVFDCMLDGSVWRLPDGALGSGSTPGIVDNGVSAVVDLRDSSWLIEGLADQAEACL